MEQLKFKPNNEIDSLQKRYFSKLITNILGLGLGLIISIIVPRGLGPKQYGDFNFLTNSFSKLLPLLTLSTSKAFFVKFSQRNHDFYLVKFYGWINLFSFFALFLFIYITQITNLFSQIWIGQNLKYVYLAALYSILVWLVSGLTDAADSIGVTKKAERIKLAQKIIALVLIFILYVFDVLNLKTYFLYHFVILILLISSLSILLNKRVELFQKWFLSKTSILKYGKEFYSYSKPLFFYSLISLVIGFFDYWILQKFGGSIQQGFFGLAFRISALSILFSSSMTSLITREFSVAHEKNDINHMSSIFRKYVPLLYSISAFIACYVSVNADSVVVLFGGSEFDNASSAMAIMAMYPIHQTYGQLSGSLFYAVGKTKLYGIINSIFIIIGLPLAFFAIAPSEYLGFEYGAKGLALKYVLIQLIAVNVQLYFNCKYLKLNLTKYIGHQIIVVSILFVLSYLVKIGLLKIISSTSSVLYIVSSGILYTIVVALIIIIYPKFFGLYKSDLQSLKNKINL